MENGESSFSGNPSRDSTLVPPISNTISTTVSGSFNRDAANVSNCNNTTINNNINVGVYEEIWWIQAWLSPLEPHKKHEDVRNRRLDGIGEWVLQRDEFMSWSKGQDGTANPTLLCHGGPGVGKTYISSLVIDTLRDRAAGQNIAVLGLYCDYQGQKDQSAVSMIGGLLRQVVWGAAEIRRAFNESKRRGGQGLRMQDMLKLFVKVISSMDRVYICVDAVDELLPESRSEFLRGVRQIVRDAPRARLFLTARPCIRAELDRHLTKGAHIIHIMADQGDITRYLNYKMDDDQYSDLMAIDLRHDIIETILDKSSEMFLLVALNINAILGETSLARRREMLRRVTAAGVDLDSVYTQTLQRIKEQRGDQSRLGIEVLMWVSHSERPLRIGELQHALAVDMEKTDLDPENIRPENIVLGSCLGLAVVDNQTSTLRLIHYTLQEYLSSRGILPDAHETLAQTCLAYLNYGQVKGLPPNRIPNPRDMPFLEYSAFYWGNHAKMGLSDRSKSLVLELLTRYDNHISATLLFNQMQSYDSPPVIGHLFSGLHCASYFGIVEAVAALIEMKGYDVNQRDCKGFTPLRWAAQRGNEAVVRLLLTRDDVSPDKADNRGQTPLWRACLKGHEGIVRLLLTRDDVNPAKPDNLGRTPLLIAYMYGREVVVRLLLTQDDVNPDKQDNYGRTLLWWASGNGKKEVVVQLLTRGDINPETPDNIGRTPLRIADMHGHHEIAAILERRIAGTSGAD